MIEISGKSLTTLSNFILLFFFTSQKTLMSKVYAEVAIIFIGNRLKTSNLEMTVLIPRKKGRKLSPPHDVKGNFYL